MKNLEPKGSLKAGNLYFGDNGRVFCHELRCSGVAAYHGWTLSGHRVKKATERDEEWWAKEGMVLSCEGCGAKRGGAK